MLTNTVVLFLRELLPMFIMFAYIGVMQKPYLQQIESKAYLLGFSLMLSVLILFLYESISDLFEGTGIEWLKITFVSVAFLGFLLAHLKSVTFYKYFLLTVASMLLLVVHLNSFLLYITIYAANTDLLYELLIGCAVGIGICVSFYFLFSFISQELWHSKYNIFIMLLWSLFTASQFSVVTNYLHQIDIISFGTERLDKFTGWVNEDSEYGFIIKALIGFDASPSVFYSLVMVISFALMFSLTIREKKTLIEESQ